MNIDYYNFSNYEWVLKTKNINATKGFFVVFTIHKGVVDCVYPLYDKKDFAFCPSIYLKQFESERGVLNEVPSYILLFNKHDIESLNAVLPLNI